MSGSGIDRAICKSAPCPRHITMLASNPSVSTAWMPFLPPNQLLKHFDLLSTSQKIGREQQLWNDVFCATWDVDH